MEESVRYLLRSGEGTIDSYPDDDGEQACADARYLAKSHPGVRYRVIKVVETEIYSTRNEA